jgi:uncharacterized protein YceK
MKRFFILILASILLLSACGTPAEPTLSAEEVQGTAMAAAMTMVAETQAAIPTATPIPPTDTPAPTPLPTNTVPPFVLPTESSLVQPGNTAVAQATVADICSDLKHVIPSGAAGPTTTVKIVNENKSPATISVYLNKTAFGECGYRSYSLAKNSSTVQTLPQGCYSAWAFSTGGKDQFNASGYGLCMNNTDKWTMVIRGESIIVLPP